MTTLSQSAAETLFGNRFLTERTLSTTFAQSEMRPTDAMRPVAEDLHRNFVDHALTPEYGGRHSPWVAS